MKLAQIRIQFMVCLLSALSLGWAMPLLCMEQETFEERLKKAAEAGKAAAEVGAENVSQKVAEESAISAKKVSEQSAITAEKIRITSENIRRAFEGQPLKPIYNEDYLRAVFIAKENGDAQDAARLIAIAPWNKDIIWSNLDSKNARVLMVSWMPKWVIDFYRPYLGKPFQTSVVPDRYIWVTAVPELKKIAQEYVKNPKPGVSLTLRLKQYLGLPDSQEEYFFVEFWVRPQDIFRPCLNTDIIGDFCLPDPNPQKLPLAYKNIFDFVPADAQYKKWFTERRDTAYTGDKPFPWTRLGYSYDWGSKEPKKIGVSEFVIRQGVTVFIHSITSTDEYPALPLPKGNNNGK